MMLKRFALAGLFAITAAIATVLGYWTQDRDPPVQSKILEIVGAVHPGGKLLVRWQVYREALCAATKQELILDIRGVRWVIPELHFKTSPGGLGFDTFVSQTDLPPDIPIGDAVLRVALAYECNPVHRLWPVVNRIPDYPITISPPRMAGMS